MKMFVIRKKRRIVLSVGILSLMLFILLFYISHFITPFKKNVCFQTIQVTGGYGYVVLSGKDTLIYQPYIPVVGRRVAFTTREDAAEAALMVCRKLMDGKAPALTSEDIRNMRINVP
jgi:hypothetical protein